MYEIKLLINKKKKIYLKIYKKHFYLNNTDVTISINILILCPNINFRSHTEDQDFQFDMLEIWATSEQTTAVMLKLKLLSLYCPF